MPRHSTSQIAIDDLDIFEDVTLAEMEPGDLSNKPGATSGYY